MADQGIDEIAAELYVVDPARFVAARTEAVQRARASGDRELATALARLRRPTVSAWAVNLLVRSVGAELAELVRLAEELHAAQRQLQGAQLRQLNLRRRELIGRLARRARQLAAEAGHPLGGAAATEVEQSLAAALADADATRQVCSGRLTRSLQHVGLGAEPLITAPLPSPVDAARDRSSAPSASSSAGSSPAALPAFAPPSQPENEVARQRRRRVERLERDLARAGQELAEAVARAARAEQEVRQAEQRCTDLDRRLAQLQQERDGVAREHAEATRRARSAARVRDEAERRVTRLTEEHKAVQ